MNKNPMDWLKAFVLGILAYFGISVASTIALTVVSLFVFGCMFACMLAIFGLAIQWLPYL